MNRSIHRLAGLLFASGLCALVYQTAWFRSLRLVFGASTASTAAVLAIFMAGLGFGGLWLGARADRQRRPLAFYAGLEATIALAAAFSPWLIDLARAVYLGVGGAVRLGPALGTGFRLLLSALILGVPAFVMGGTLPAMARAVAGAGDPERRKIGVLYGWNTLGAVAGTVLTTFWLIELIGIRRSIWLAAAINLLLALLARAWARESGEMPVAAEREEARTGGTNSSRIVLISAFAVGFVFLLMELVWYRMLAPLLGGTTYTFGLILAVALAGIGIGGLLFSVASPRRPTLSTFAVSCAIEAVALALPFAAGDRIADLALALRGFSSWGFGPLAFGWTLLVATIVLLPAVVAGYQFPLLVALLGSDEERVGSEVGAAYAWNTLGAICGSLAGGFGLMPLLGATGLWRGSVVALAALSGIILLVGGGARLRSRAGRWAIGFSLFALVLVAARGPTPAWRHRPIGAGRVVDERVDLNALRDSAHEVRRDTYWEADGREASVALLDGTGFAFVINGKSDGHAIYDADTQVMSGLAGALLHPDPKRALVIGLGTGSTAGWLAAIPAIERVDVVEIEPEIVRVARDCAQVNLQALDNPRLGLILDDARSLLQTTNEVYDVIFSEPSNPYRVGVSSLFSREFYRQVSGRLADDGIFLQWLQSYEIDADLVRMVFGTLAAEFPAIETWQVGDADLLLVATKRPLVHDFERVARRLREEPYRSALAWTWGVEGVAGFYSGFIAEPGFAAELARDAAHWIEEDDRPRLEFGFARSLGRPGLFSIQKLRQIAAQRGWSRLPAGGPSEVALTEALGARMLAELARAQEIAAARWGLAPASPRAEARLRWATGRLPEALSAWTGNGGAQPIERTLIAESLAVQGSAQVFELLPEIRLRAPVEADLIEALYHQMAGDLPAALLAFQRGFELLRSDPRWHPPLVERSLLRAREAMIAAPEPAGALLRALAEPFVVHALNELRMDAVLDTVLRIDRDRGCRAALAPFEPEPQWREAFLASRLACYLATGSPLAERARADLEAFVAAAPPSVDDWFRSTGKTAQ